MHYFRCFDVGTEQDGTTKFALIDIYDGSIKERGRNSFHILIQPECSLHLIVFNVRTPTQMGQQAALAKILEAFIIDVTSVSEMRIQGLTSVITHCNPGATLLSRFLPRVSSDPVSIVRGQTGNSTKLRMLAKLALLNRITVN